MRIYVASSWKNNIQPEVVRQLREHGYSVYDFKNPASGDTGLRSAEEGFHWSDVKVSGQAVDWRDWSPLQLREALDSPLACKGFKSDMDALNWCEACVLVLPCGKSAHLELGQAVGAGKRTIVYMPHQSEPELMYKMCSHFCTTMGEVLAALALGPVVTERCWSCGGQR